jgi:hypothetical protein
MEILLTEFVSAGFLITREVPRPSYVSAELLPDRIISASGCIAHFIPDTWCIEWAQEAPESRLEEARGFALDSLALAKVTEWATQQFEKSIGWPNVIMSLDSARRLFHSFLSSLPDVKVLELVLHESMREVFCQEAEPLPPQPGHSPEGRQGVHEAILKMNAPTPGGHVLGFEPLVFDGSLSCSWLCNSLDTVVAEALEIKPNQHGLIGTFADAYKCVEYISRDDVGAEPGLWLPWLMIDHTGTVRQSVPADA